MKGIDSIIVEVDLCSVRSPKYHENVAKYGNNSNTCEICGKQVKDLSTANYIHLLTNGNIVSSNEDFDNSQGFFPVGSDCAKKLFISFTTKNF